MTAPADLTILLSLKDRAEFTRRWLTYAATAPLGCRILIADGGADDAVGPILDEWQRRLDVSYVRYPFDADYGAYYAKIADALARVTTPFVVLADNDDLFVPGALRQAVEFLQAHPDHVACGGQTAVFWLGGRGGGPAASRPYGDVVEWKCSSRVMSDAAGTAEQRLRDRCHGAHEVFYAVHRTDVLRRHFEAVRACNPSDLFLMPELVMFLGAISGRTHQLETLYLARQQDSPGSSGGAHEAVFGDWVDRMLVPSWSGDFTRFVECAAAALSAADGIAIDRARRIVIECYKASVAPSLLGDILEEPTVTFTMPLVLQIVRRLVALPPRHWLRRVAQALYRRSRWLSSDVVYGVEFRTRGAGAAARQFAPLGRFLMERR